MCVCVRASARVCASACVCVCAHARAAQTAAPLAAQCNTQQCWVVSFLKFHGQQLPPPKALLQPLGGHCNLGMRAAGVRVMACACGPGSRRGRQEEGGEARRAAREQARPNACPGPILHLHPPARACPFLLRFLDDAMLADAQLARTDLNASKQRQSVAACLWAECRALISQRPQMRFLGDGSFMPAPRFCW